MSQSQIEEFEVQFKAYAEQLFRNEYPPPPNSQVVNLEIIDQGETRNDTTDFLYSLFTYGFVKKMETGCHNMMSEEEFFMYINGYMKTLGFEAILHDYTRDPKTNEIVNINIGFKNYTGGI
jgi:hypothetical protein